MSNFITRHIIQKIGKMVDDKQSILKGDGFFYFDETISDKSYSYVRIINRINRNSPYIQNNTYQSSWYVLKGVTLLKIFDKVKNNKFYVYKKIDGKDHKVRLKNNND